MKGFSRVFSFTLRKFASSKAYIAVTLSLAILLLAVPPCVMLAVASSEEKASEDIEEMLCPVKTVYFADLTDAPVSPEFLNGSYGDEKYMAVQSIDEAKKLISETPNSLAVIINKDTAGYKVDVVAPDSDVFTEKQLDSFAGFFESAFGNILMVKSGLSESELSELLKPVSSERVTIDADVESGTEDVKEIVGMIMPYISVMLLYFVVLIYGQYVSNCVILEKTSKLMDTFLVSVSTTSMVMGKVIAVALSGLCQITAWALSAVAGFALGAYAVDKLFPGTLAPFMSFLGSLGGLSGMFGIPQTILALLILSGGILVYCAIAAVGGAMASKPEDLSSTNGIFSMTVVASLLLCVYSGGITGMTSGAQWLDFLPFTAILITPGRLLSGATDIFTGAVSLGLILLCALLVMALAGKIYKMMAFYKGDVPNAKKIIDMLKQERGNK